MDTEKAKASMGGIRRSHQALMRLLDPSVAPYLPDEAWAELSHRFTRLEQRMLDFTEARRKHA